MSKPEKMVSIKELRSLTGLSRPEFGKRYYDIPVNSIRDWEQGLRKCPDYVVKLLEFRVRQDLKERGKDEEN